MPRTRRRTSIRTKLLIILLAAVLVPTLVVTAILIRTGIQAQRAEAEAVLEAVNEAVSDSTRDFISDVDSILTSVGVFHAFADRDLPEQTDTLNNILARFPFFRSLRVYYEFGTPFASAARGGLQWEPPNEVLSEGFRQAIGGAAYISPVHYTDDGNALVLMMVPIGPPGQSPVGVMAGTVGLDHLQEIADRFSIANSQSVLIVDRAGRALAVPRSYEGISVGDSLLQLKPVSDLIAAGDGSEAAGSVTYADPTGVEMLAVYDRIADVGWGVIVQQPVSAILRPPFRSIALALLWMAGFALFFAVLGRLVSLRVTRPLARLREGTEVIGAGNLHYRVNVSTGDELEDVADSFNRTAARLEASYTELEREHAQAVASAKQADTLLRLSQALVSTLNLDERLDLIAQSLADVCDTDKVALWLLRGNVLVPTASYGLTEDEEKAFSRWEVHLEESLEMTREVFVTRKPLVIVDAAADPRVPAGIAERFDIRTILAIPLLIEDEITGYAITYQKGRTREFTDNQVSMARAVAAQAAVAIQNAQAYERERRISDTLQRSLLPHVPPRFGAFEIADVYESALTEAEIGGDFYDLIEISPTQIGFVMADISGKGLNAAVHTAMIKYMLRAYALEDIDKLEMVRRLNRGVWKYIGMQMFVTFFYGILDTETKQLSYVNAGHELPLLFSEDRRLCTRLETTGTALGIVPEYDFGEASIEFMPGDSLLMYTDGATDVRRDGQFLGEDGLEEIFCNAASGTAHEIIAAVDAGIREYAGGQLHDDIAMMVIKYRRDGSDQSAE